MQQRLTRAGYRDEQAVKIFYGCKVLVPLLLCAVALVSGAGEPGPVFCVSVALGGGFLAAGLLAGEEDCGAAKADYRADCPTCWICW